jgi:hypothetical protein
MATTKIKLWQLQGADSGRLLITDNEGKLAYLQPDLDKSNPVLSIDDNGIPYWANNLALSKALEALSQIDTTLHTANSYTDQRITDLVAGAPVALDTLKELADKLGEDGEALAALIVQLDGKANKNEVYKKADVNLLVADRYQTATAYTDALKAAILNSVKVPKMAMMGQQMPTLSLSETSIIDFQRTDGDPIPMNVPLEITQVFINGQLGVKNVDYVVEMPNTTLNDVALKFPSIPGDDAGAYVAVMVRWEEPLQLIAPQVNAGGNP